MWSHCTWSELPYLRSNQPDPLFAAQRTRAHYFAVVGQAEHPAKCSICGHGVFGPCRSCTCTYIRTKIDGQIFNKRHPQRESLFSSVPVLFPCIYFDTMLLSISILIGIAAVARGQAQGYAQCMSFSPSLQLQDWKLMTDENDQVEVRAGAVLQPAYLALFVQFLGISSYLILHFPHDLLPEV